MKLIPIKIYPLCHGFSLYSSLSFIFFLYHTCKNLKEVVDQGVAFSAYYVMQTAVVNKQVRYVICCTTTVSTSYKQTQRFRLYIITSWSSADIIKYDSSYLCKNDLKNSKFKR